METIDARLSKAAERDARIEVPEIDICDKVMLSVAELDFDPGIPFNVIALILSGAVAFELWVCGPLYIALRNPLGDFFRMYAGSIGF
ncbi:MAG: hypothetical protein PHQ23_04530 [Candidatus Wallbacteria bacterium]|nr:hypothetical protein [Candidatus Wallbacteria bacterium]